MSSIITPNGPQAVAVAAAQVADRVLMPLHGAGANLEDPINRAYWRCVFAGMAMLATSMTSEIDNIEEDARQSVIRADALILELRATATLPNQRAQ